MSYDATKVLPKFAVPSQCGYRKVCAVTRNGRMRVSVDQSRGGSQGSLEKISEPKHCQQDSAVSDTSCCSTIAGRPLIAPKTTLDIVALPFGVPGTEPFEYGLNGD
jgi:hypothetical protein